jgi:hypothetical protein
MCKTDLVDGLKKYDINGYVNLIRAVVDVSWPVDDPKVGNSSRLEEADWGSQYSGVQTPPVHNNCHSGNGSAAESTPAQPIAYRGARSVRSPSAATGLPAHPFFHQSETPLAQSLAAPPQSLSGNSKTGTVPSQSAFKSDFNYLGRYEEDNSKLKGWKADETTKLENDKSKVGALKESEIAAIRSLCLAEHRHPALSPLPSIRAT